MGSLEAGHVATLWTGFCIMGYLLLSIATLQIWLVPICSPAGGEGEGPDVLYENYLKYFRQVLCAVFCCHTI